MRSASLKNLSSIVLFLFTLAFTMGLYQNCSEVRFEARDLPSTAPAGTLATDPDPISLLCTFNGETYSEGQTVIAYQNSSVAYGQACVSEMRKCEAGRLSGSFNYTTCDVAAPKSCLFNGRTIPHNGTVDAFQNSSVAYGATCEREARVCNNGVLSGSYQFAACAPQAPASCLFNGRTIAHGQRVVAYRNSAVAFGELCDQEERVCRNGSLSGSYTYASCAPAQPRACTFNGRSIAHGESVTAFLNPSVSYGQSCASQPRTCNNGTLTGSYNYATCEVGAPRTCLFNGHTVAHGQEVTAFQSSSVAYGSVCVSQPRRCDNGILSGTYTFASCNVAQPASCLFNGRTVAHGESITGYFTSRVPFGSTCRSVNRVCQNGVFTGDGSAIFASCAVDEPASCLFAGRTIAHGERVTAFVSSSVAYGQTCVSQDRLCTNGSLSGTYSAPSCEPESPRTCTFNGQTVPHGSSLTAYQTAVVPFGQTCASERRTCQNGSLSGSFAQPGCTVTPPANCSFNGRMIQHGTGVIAYASANVAFGGTCASQTRFCSNGSLSGSYTAETCTVTPPQSCAFNGRVVAHGETVTGYLSTAVAYGRSCTSEVRVCGNGVLSGVYGAASCTVLPPANCSFNGQVVTHGAQVTAFASPSVPFGSGCQSQIRTCANGVLDGTYGFGSCQPEAPRSCSLTIKVKQFSSECPDCGVYEYFVDQTVTLRHGETRNLYSTGSMGSRVQSGPCSTLFTQPRTCDNGVVQGNAYYTYESCMVYEISGGSPLMVHFNSDAEKPEPLKFTSLIDGILFDILGRNSKPEAHSPMRISWYRSPQYYFLALPDANGKVRGVDQLFGNNTFGPDGKFADDGYKALAKFDGRSADGKTLIGKADGYITKNDPVFANLRLWNDVNFDGIAQGNELKTLEEMQVEVIDLNADSNYYEKDRYGNQTTLKSVVKTRDGRYHLMFDIWFNYGGPK